MDSDVEYSSSEYSDKDSILSTESEYKFKKCKDSCLELQKNHLKGIADVLQDVVKGTIIPPINFCSEDELCIRDISLKVEGIGRLTFPLKDHSIQKLISISTKARFGKGEETLLNEDIRDTHEIPGKELQVTINQSRFSQMLGKIRSEIGLSDGCFLEAQLHNMLIYSPGQFFDFHQDSEKATDMIGTLVIVLPSPHIGGNLVIQHGTKEHIFISENLASKSFKCICFYADCRHKIEKVREGFRVALTYKVILKSGDNIPVSYVNQNLKDAIQNYFSDCKIRNDAFQKKFVYFLDHSYSEHSLKWNLLKGEDQIKGNSLLAVAKLLDLVPYLALIEIQYIWRNLHDYRHHCANPIPIDLDEVNYNLLNFVNSNNEKQPFKDHYGAREKEICWTKETTASFKHYSSYCEGFTGNEGLTVDYWYKRAAVVLWPSSMQMQLQFRLNYEEALKELQAETKTPGKEKEVCETVKQCGRYLYNQSKCEKKYFEALAEIALYIKDKDVSVSFLSHFKWEILNCGISESLSKLDSQYGSMWCNDLLNKWKYEETSFGSHYMDNNYIFNKVNSFVEQYLGCGGSFKVVEIILDEQISKISLETVRCTKLSQMEKAMTKGIQIVCEFIISCALIKNSDLVGKVMKYIISNPQIFTSRNLLGLYLELKEALPPNDIAYCEPLKTYMQTSISIEIANEARAKHDWSIKKLLDCQCKHCKEVNGFLLSKTEKKREWKIFQTHQEHVEHQCKRLALPVSFVVETKMGISKFTIIKRETCQEDRRKKCAELKLYLKKLQ